MAKEITIMDDLRSLVNSKVKAQKIAEETASKIQKLLTDNLVGKCLLELDKTNYHTYIKVESIEVDYDLHLSIKGVSVEHSEDYVDLGIWTTTHYYSYKNLLELQIVSQEDFQRAWDNVVNPLNNRANEECN